MNSKHILRLGLGAMLSLGLAPAAFAAGTDAGTNITNTASVAYDVSGIPQPPETSTTDDFEVDRLIVFTVAETGNGNTLVVPGATNEAVSFVVQNDSNATMDFYLTVEEPTGDDFNGADGGATVEYYLDDGDGVFDGGDTLITFLNNVPEYDGTPATQRVVHVVYDIDSPLADGDTADIILVAQATPDGSVAATPYVATVGAETAGTVDTVFGDTTGDATDVPGAGTNDVARDGFHSATDTYEVDSANLTVSKTSRIVTDPINCTVDGDSTSCSAPPKRIPGAVIQYCITVENTGGVSADDVVITDAVPANTTYVAGSIWTNVTGATTTCDLTDTLTAAGNLQAEDDNAADADETDPAGGSFAANTVTVQLKPDVGASGIARASFRVTID